VQIRLPPTKKKTNWASIKEGSEDTTCGRGRNFSSPSVAKTKKKLKLKGAEKYE